MVLHSATLVLPIATEPIRNGAVAVRGERVLRVGPRDELLGRYRVTEEHHWRGTIVAGLVDAYASGGAPGPGVVARAAELGDPAAAPGSAAGVAYVPVTCESEREWEESRRDALITAIHEMDRPVGIAPHTRDPHVLEDVALLARTFGLRLLVDLDRHSLAGLDEAGVLGPHCHAACARPLDPGERKLLKLRGTTVALRPGPGVGEWPALVEEGIPLAIGTAAGARGRAGVRGGRPGAGAGAGAAPARAGPRAGGGRHARRRQGPRHGGRARRPRHPASRRPGQLRGVRGPRALSVLRPDARPRLPGHDHQRPRAPRLTSQATDSGGRTFLHYLPYPERRRLLGLGAEKRFPAGQVLMRQG
ncbi:hypothetical protein ACFSTC_14395 [Nonomuraea ferruginea]